MNFKRILSCFLAFMFIFGIIGEAAVVNVSAAWADKVDADGNPIINYYQKSYSSDKEKLSAMTLYKEEKGYRIYVEEFTGEIAFVDAATGNAIFSNPYDLASNANSSSTKDQLLSQLTISFKENEDDKSMNSYKDAALRGQIKTKNIKNGLRMEYTIGEIQVTRLVPRQIPKERFETLILDKITSDFHRERLLAFYQLYDRNDTSLTETLVKEMEAKFPITKRMAIYICSTSINSTELKQLESIIKTYCPLYTYDEMEQDHSDTDYVGVDIAPPCFRMAIEYTVDEDGLNVRLPANGIRFDESVYKLNTVSVLPYMGAGNTNNEGYTFVPDGSGAIIRYSDIQGQSSSISGSVYGKDYAYHSVTGRREETIRYPVFGNVVSKSTETSTTTTGYVAIITEGDSLAQIIAENGGPLHKYSSVYARFTPRPSDQYNLSDTLGSGSNASWTVVTNRKYSGSYKIKYILLSNDENANNGHAYECSYVGMAKAYRDYLINEGVLTRLTAEDVESDTPLYIETFGSLETNDKFLSFPIVVDTPITTFENVATMYDELSANGVSNIKFRLTGYANGGLESTYPAKINWVSALGGKSGFKDLLNYSVEKNFGVYPDFDFAYVAKTAYFDGINAKRDQVKTIDSRYTSRKYYDSATQSLENDFAHAVSPSRYEYFANKFAASYAEYGVQSLSLSTMGTDLNSDFDKKDPYNREDSKNFTSEMLAILNESFSDIMVNGGNAYSLGAADHVIDAPIDSSNYMSASQSVPFAGFVLHGFVNFTGSAINMEGDIVYSMLKSIENGANLYFTLAYQNTNVLKESSTYNKYYSVDYDIWREEIAEYYKTMNEAMKDVQTAVFEEHEFITGYRIPDKAELDADKKAAEEKAKSDAETVEAAKKRAELDALLADRKNTTPPTTAPVTSDKTEVTVPTKTTADGVVYSTNSKYQTTEGTIVRVEYDNGISFIINYNSHDVYVKLGGQEYVIEALSFVKIG